MKRFTALIFSVLLVAFLSTSFTHIEKYVDNDVGYSLTIDQNITVVTIPTISVPVISGESFLLLDRGVSVPLKYPNQEAITNINFISPLCNIDNYSQRSIITNFECPLKGVNRFACDLGNRKS